MKKIAALLLALLLLLPAGCRKTAEPVLQTEPTEAERVQPETEPAAPIQAPEQSEQETTEPVQTSEQTEPGAAPTAAPTEEASPAESIQLTIYTEGGNQSVEAIYYENGLRGGDAPISFSLYYDNARLEPVFAANAYRFLPLPEQAADAAEPEEAENAEETGGEEEAGEEAEESAEEPLPAPPGDSLTYFEVSLINGTTVNAISPTFIDGYLDFTDIEFTSYARVGAQRLEAGCVSAGNEEQYVEAYLINVSGGVAVVVLSTANSGSENLLWFRAMLSTFRLL